MTFNKSKVQKLFVSDGRSTMIKFPCNIKSFSTGPTKDITALANERDSSVLEIWLSKLGSQPSGIKVLCNDHFFVFDVVPSQNTHQDFLQVTTSYGVPANLYSSSFSIKKVLTSSEESNSAKLKKPKIIRVISSSEALKND